MEQYKNKRIRAKEQGHYQWNTNRPLCFISTSYFRYISNKESIFWILFCLSLTIKGQLFMIYKGILVHLNLEFNIDLCLVTNNILYISCNNCSFILLLVGLIGNYLAQITWLLNKYFYYKQAKQFPHSREYFSTPHVIKKRLFYSQQQSTPFLFMLFPCLYFNNKRQ